MPRDLESCGQLPGGPANVCDVGYACVPAGDAGAPPTCVQVCTTSADCQDPATWCVAGAISVDGGAPVGGCELHACDAVTEAYRPCDVAGVGDGQCLPYASSTSTLTGVCTRTGQVAAAAPCTPVGGPCAVCAAGSICARSNSAEPRSICLAACDATGDAGPACGAPQVCAPFGDQDVTKPNPGVCEPAPVSTTFPAPHAAYPQIPTGGGHVLGQPEVVVITYADYDDPNTANRASIEGYMTSLVQSSWLEQVGADYGVGTGTVDLVELATTAPGANTDPSEVTTELCNLIENPPANFPQPNENTVYMFFYPSTTTFTDGSCVSYAGYHNWTARFGDPKCNDVVFAVVLDCPLDPLYQDLTDLETVEGAASHEFIESAVDPYLPGGGIASGYIITDPTSPWASVGGEVGDVCVFNYLVEPFGVVQRIWSNVAAATGKESPCIPEAAEPFSTVSVSPGTVQIGSGTTFDFTVTGWSDQAAPPFVVTPYYFGSPTTTKITYSMNRSSFSNGAEGTLSVTVPAGDTDDYLSLLVLVATPGVSEDVWSWAPVGVCSDAATCPL